MEAGIERNGKDERFWAWRNGNKEAETCANCEHFHQHYVKDPQVMAYDHFIMTGYGHCVHKQIRIKKPEDICEHFTSRYQDNRKENTMNKLERRKQNFRELMIMAQKSESLYPATIGIISAIMSFNESPRHKLTLIAEALKIREELVDQYLEGCENGDQK